MRIHASRGGLTLEPQAETRSARFQRAVIWAFGRFAWIFVALQLLLFLPIQWQRTDRDRDVVAYHLVIERIEAGGSMYEPHPPPGPHRPDTWYYLYPPFLASGLALLPPLEFESFARVWLIVLLAAFWLYAACLCRLATGSIRLHGVLVAGAVLGMTPGAIRGLNMGQADVLLWPMIGVALAFPALRGAGFVAATMTKVYGVWTLIVACVRERRVVIVSAVIAAAAGVTLACIGLGPGVFFASSLEWIDVILPSVTQGQFMHGDPAADVILPLGLGSVSIPAAGSGNLSISFAPLTLAQALGWQSEGQLPFLLRAYLFLMATGAPLAAAWRLRSHEPAMQYAMVAAVSLLFAPIFRMSNIPLLLAPAAIFLRSRR